VDRWLLVVRMAVLTAAVFALAGPLLSGGSGGRLVAVVDVSASMVAPDPADPERSRLETAVARARARVKAVGPQWVLIIAAGARPRAIGGWQSVRAAGKTLGSLAAEQGPSDMPLALEEARGLAGPGRVLAFSDDGAPIPGNRALLRLVFRPDLHTRERGTFLVTVRRAAGAPNSDPQEELFVRVDTGGKQVGTVRVPVGSDGRGTATLAYRGPGGAPARAKLLGEDGLPADDSAAVEVPRLTRRRVALVTAGNPELERALAAWPRGHVTVHPAGHHPRADLLVLDGGLRAPPDRAAVFVRPGESRPVDTVPVPTRPGGLPGIAAASGLTLTHSTTLPEPPPGAEPLLRSARAARAPLLWLRSTPTPARAALAFDPGAAGLAGSPLHAVFWADLLHELLLPEDGGCARAEVGADTESGPLTRPGLYRLPSGCVIASVPETESFPAPAATPPTRELGTLDGRREIGGWLAGLAALLLLAEALLARRSRGAGGMTA